MTAAAEIRTLVRAAKVRAAEKKLKQAIHKAVDDELTR